MKFFELISPNARLDFLGRQKMFIAVSILALIASILLVVVKGPRYGIDFRGGTEIILHFESTVNDDAVRDAARKIGLEDASVQRYGDGTKSSFLVQTQAVSVADADKVKKIVEALGAVGKVERSTWSAEQPDRLDLVFAEAADLEKISQTVVDAGIEAPEVTQSGQEGEPRYLVRFPDLGARIKQGLKAEFGEAFSEENGIDRIESVGPRAGEQLRNSGIVSILVALLAILIYIWFRFDIRYSPGAVLALLHDVTIALGVFVLFDIEISLPIIAAFLTIVGYSLNDTIIVFDRIRENLSAAGAKSVQEVVNDSINETLSRTIITSLTTILAVTAIAIVGGGLIQSFAIALLVGIVVGTYSSVFIASPMMVRMHNYLQERKKTQAILDAAQAPVEVVSESPSV